MLHCEDQIWITICRTISPPPVSLLKHISFQTPNLSCCDEMQWNDATRALPNSSSGTGISGSMKTSFSLTPHLLLKAMVWIFWPAYQKIPHPILYERQLRQWNKPTIQRKHLLLRKTIKWTHSSYFSMEVFGSLRFFFFFLTFSVSNLHMFSWISISERLFNLLL